MKHSFVRCFALIAFSCRLWALPFLHGKAKVSAGVSTGIGDHESKYTGKESDSAEGDEQFEISDDRSFDKMYQDMSQEGLQPVLNDYLYV